MLILLSKLIAKFLIFSVIMHKSHQKVFPHYSNFNSILLKIQKEASIRIDERPHWPDKYFFLLYTHTIVLNYRIVLSCYQINQSCQQQHFVLP